MSAATESGTSYDAVPYDDRAFYRTHPDVLATVATLHGLRPAPVDACRVLELGCAVGGNLIPLAVTMPGARLVGIDLSPRQIDTGSAIARELGLGSVDLRAISITDVDASLGTFDYVICHGVYSWVPPVVQEAILRICAERLAPDGIAYVSYNTYPGWHLRGMVRDVMRHHARAFSDPDVRMREARTFLDAVIAVQGERSPHGAYLAALREEAALLRDAPDDYVFHEHLEDQNAPLYFLDFVERARRHGLAYVDDARPRDHMGGLPPAVRTLVESQATTPVAREQSLDFLLKGTFRRSLLCHEAAGPAPELDPHRVALLFASSRTCPVSPAPSLDPGVVERFQAPDSGATVSTNEPVAKGALVRLAQAWPSGIAFDRLASDLGLETEERRALLAVTLLRCYLSGVVELHTRPPVCAVQAGARPVASPVARWQAARQARVTNLLHRAVELPDAERLLLRLLDGTRDRQGVLEALVDAVASGRFRLERDGRPLSDVAETRALLATWVDPMLDGFARAGLLLA